MDIKTLAVAAIVGYVLLAQSTNRPASQSVTCVLCNCALCFLRGAVDIS